MADRWNDESVVAEHLFEQCSSRKWLDQSYCANAAAIGVAVRCADESYAFEPANVDQDLKQAVYNMAAPVVVSVSSSITSTALGRLAQQQMGLGLQSRGYNLPTVASLAEVPSRAADIRKSCACLVSHEGVVLILAESVADAIATATDVEQMLMEEIWGATIGRASNISRPTSIIRSTSSYKLNFDPAPISSMPSSRSVPSMLPRSRSSPTLPGLPFSKSAPSVSSTQELSFVHLREKKQPMMDVRELNADKEDYDLKIDYDPEAKKSGIARRPMLLTHSLMMALALLIIFVVISFILKEIVTEIKYDRNWLRLAILLVIPIYAGFAGGSAITIVNSAFQLLMPISDTLGNSRFHSAIAPNPAKFPDMELPHITIQIPIFKEGLRGVIAPTINSVKAAVRHYENLGGTASIYVNEDGMQVIDPELADARRVFYRDNDVAYCARPRDTGKDGFVRTGRFKKASNMNYGLHFSTRVEDELIHLVEARSASLGGPVEMTILTREEENELYLQAFKTILESDEGRTEAAGNVRIGEYILLIDCDTRVPVNCLQMAALEMAESPEVAIVQHTSGVLKVAHNLFETGISFLTHLIYTTIRFNVASGDCAVFVGHNAFLRWSAVQSIAYEKNGQMQWWSDDHVSEDWHLSLRLQIAGFQIRLATYHGDEFQEGVSLNIYDEIARWEKYAYGCNELVFNPIHRWYKGPITKLYLSYFMSGVKPSSKLMALSYTFSYYAIAFALPLCFVNYMLVGLIPNTLDTFYVTSWKIYLVILVIFNVMAPIAYCVIRWRLRQQEIWQSALQTIATLPLLILYFGGLSFHLLKAVTCHFFGIKIEWTATAKELESSHFFVGIDRIFTDFASMYLVLFSITGAMVYLGVYADVGWAITNWTAILPLANQMVCHFLVPIILAF